MPNGIPTPLSSLTYKATDLQRSLFTVQFEITLGLDELAEVRGEDTIIPALAGRTGRNRVKDYRPIELSGWIQGTGATEALRLASYRDLIDEMTTLFDPAAAAGTLSGLAWDSTTRSIVARSLGLRPGPVTVYGAREFVVLLESIVPDWTVT